MGIRTCVICGAEFQSKNARKKTCSVECSRKLNHESQRAWRQSKKTPIMKVCPVCGKEFETAYATKKYCGVECATVANRAMAREAERRKYWQEKGQKKKSKKKGETKPKENHIAEINQAARDKNMSYGIYKAQEQIEKYARVIIE